MAKWPRPLDLQNKRDIGIGAQFKPLVADLRRRKVAPAGVVAGGHAELRDGAVRLERRVRAQGVDKKSHRSDCAHVYQRAAKIVVKLERGAQAAAIDPEVPRAEDSDHSRGRARGRLLQRI